MSSGSQQTTGTAGRTVISVNLEVESHDVTVAGGAGLFGRYSYGRYGAREGIWRLLDMLRSEQVEATFFVDAEDAARHTHLIEAILSGGHEVAHLGSPELEGISDKEQLRHVLGAAREKLSALTGQPVSGWRSAAGIMTVETLPVLAELGYLYDSSFQDDDHPYIFQDNGNSLVELPTFKFLTDTTFYSARRTDETVRKAWGEEFAAMHIENSYIALTVNARGDFGSGRSPRTKIVGDWINRAKRTPGIQISRCDQLATDRKVAGGAVEPFPFLEEFVEDLG